MLLAAVVAALVCALVLCLVAAVALRVCKRLGLNPIEVLEWFGLAERPLTVPRHRRRRLGELLAADPPATAR
jgi:hypothetical protein